jgi:anti-sigma B factor antagonist
MRIGERQFGDVVVLDISGPIAGANAVGMIDAALQRSRAAGRRNIVANLSKVPSVDLIGLEGLVGACRTMRKAGGELSLAGITNRIHDLLVITRLLTVFDTFDSIEEAVGATPTYPGVAGAAQPSTMWPVQRFLRGA